MWWHGCILWVPSCSPPFHQSLIPGGGACGWSQAVANRVAATPPSDAHAALPCATAPPGFPIANPSSLTRGRLGSISSHARAETCESAVVYSQRVCFQKPRGDSSLEACMRTDPHDTAYDLCLMTADFSAQVGNSQVGASPGVMTLDLLGGVSCEPDRTPGLRPMRSSTSSHRMSFSITTVDFSPYTTSYTSSTSCSLFHSSSKNHCKPRNGAEYFRVVLFQLDRTSKQRSSSKLAVDTRISAWTTIASA